jgi:ferrochelatase
VTEERDEVGLLCMSYGTSRGPEDLEQYLTHVRRGREPSPELIEEMRARYDAIGGRSPLIEITDEQTRGLQKELNAAGDRRFRAYHGMKHQSPYLEDVVEQMAKEGVTRGLGLVLAPHYSRFSVGEYIERVEATASGLGIKLTFVESYAGHPAFVEFVADRVREGQARLENSDRAFVLFTAHSLPVRIMAAGDPYADELRATADAVAKEVGLGQYDIAWQSAGRTGEEWLGPDVNDAIRDLAREGQPAVIVCPVGFVSDHLEVLYDIDIEARQTADETGITLVRTRSPNADGRFLRVLAAVVNEHLEREGW